MNKLLRDGEGQPDKAKSKALGTDEERQRISRYTERFSRANQATKANHDKWRVLDMFDRSEQWKDADLPPWVPKPVHNMIRYVRILKRANLASSIPAAHFVPLNEKHKALITRLQAAYKHVWDTEKVPYTIRRCIDRIYVQGTSIACVYSDESFIDGTYYGEGSPDNQMYQGIIKVKRFPNANFFPDPDAFTIEEATFIETTESTTMRAIKKNPKFRKYAGDKKMESLKNGSSAQSDDETGQVYNRNNNPFESLTADESDERVSLHTHWEMTYDENGKKKLSVAYYLPGNDFELYRVENVKPAVFPFAVLYDEEEENDFWGTATAWDVLEKQKLINKTEQTASIIATLYQNPQKIVARESGINGQEMAKMGTKPGRVWTSNIEPSRAVHVLNPGDIPKGLFDIKDRNVADIKDYVGINEAYSGESIGSLTTSTGVNSLIERATIRDKDKMKQIDNFVSQLSNLIVLFILEKWKEKRPLVNIGPAGKVTHSEWEPIKDIDKENLRWLVHSDVYASAPTTQALKKQQADNLLQMQMQLQPDPAIITIEEWLNMQDFDNKPEILARMEKDRKKKEAREAEDFAAVAVQLSEQAQQLTAQGAAPEEVTKMLTEQAKKILDGNAKKEGQVGFGGAIMEGSGRPKDAKEGPEAPKGDTGAMAMMAQAKGG